MKKKEIAEKKPKKEFDEQLAKDYAEADQDPDTLEVIKDWSVLDIERWPEDEEG